MSLKNKLGSVIQQANNYLENVNIKEKVLEIKDKTVDKVKGIDNPEHYTAPTGFELFTIPVAMSTPEITKTLEKIEPFGLKEQEKVIDAYVRMLSLLKQNETIKDAIIATMKRPYLIVWTSLDRLLIVHKEHYKIYSREEMRTFKVTKTSTFGISFQLNQYELTGSEKAKTYLFIRNYCHEYTKSYTFTPYLAISKNLNYYERFKYEKLSKENDALKENRQLCILFDPFEFPLTSVFGTFLDTIYILVLTTSGKVYLINEKEYAVFPKEDVKKIELMNKGVFSQEFYMDNYYFTKAGQEHNVLNFIQYINDPVQFEAAKNAFLTEYQVLVTFPFKEATSYQTPSGDAIVISANKSSFLICHSMNQMKMYQKEDFLRYELVKEYEIAKDDMWKGGKISQEAPMQKLEALQNYEKIRFRVFVKKSEEPVLELPFMLLKKVVYKEPEEMTAPSRAVAAELLDVLDYYFKS